MEPNWLIWARELQALAQTGLAYTKDPFDRDRFAAIQRVAARMMAEPAGAELAEVEKIFAEERGYATPKVGVRAAVFREDGAILMVREMTDGRWALPGGWADVNQSPRESVEREVREETGFEVRTKKLAAVFDRAEKPGPPSWPFHIWRLFFLCDITGGELRTSYETPEVRFFAESELPADADLSPNRSNRHHLARMFAHYREPEMPTEFE